MTVDEVGADQLVHAVRKAGPPDASGVPELVPADGLTTRQRRQRPLLIIHTGDGKGKSTAAFGLALRGWNQGWSVGIFQFVKSARWRIGEQRVGVTRRTSQRYRARRLDRVAQDGCRLVVEPQGGYRR